MQPTASLATRLDGEDVDAGRHAAGEVEAAEPPLREPP